MSKLDSILISGIRSYGIENHDIQKLKFYSPLTLFLGQNGCGKTTIIESIKYACTGELPGGSKCGQGFVSDPYIHHVPHVLGQIRLALEDVRGNKAMIIRVMRSEKIANGNLKFSCLDNTLKYVKADGVPETLSGRAADINSMTINLMGISQAILNNVIFCHQEQSLWPLDEGSQVKKKFDDIFDSAKYNQCVDTIRKLLKTKENQYKLLAVEVKYSRETKNEVERKKLQLQHRETKLETYKTEINVNEDSLVPIENRLKEICELENTLMELGNSLSVKKNERKNVVSLQNNIKANLEHEFEGTDGELQAAIDDFHNREEERNTSLQNFKKLKQECEQSEKSLNDSMQKKQAKLVQIREEIKLYKNKMSERDTLIQDLASSMNLGTYSLESSEDSILTISTLSESIQNENQAIVELSNKFKKSERKLQTEIDKFREKCAQTQQEISFKKVYVNDLQKEEREIKTKLKDLDVSDEKFKQFQRNIASIDDDLEMLTNSFNEEQLTNTIQSDKKQIRVFEENLESLEKESKIIQKNGITEHELELQKGIVQGREGDTRRIINDHFEQLNTLFNPIPGSDFRKSVEKLRTENNNLVSEVNKKIAETQNVICTAETELKHEEKDLASTEKELSVNKSKVMQLCGSMEYTRKCNEVQTSLNQLQTTKGELSSAKILYEKFIKDFRAKKCCPVCTTNFSNQGKDINEIIAPLQRTIQGIPTELKRVQEDLKKQDELYTKLLQLKPINDKIVEITAKIPVVQEKLQKTRENLDASRAKLAQYQKDIKRPQLIVDTCGKLISAATLLDQNNTEINNAQAKIVVLKTQLIRVGSGRSQHQTEIEITNTKFEITALRDACDINQRKINNTNKQLQDLREKKNKIVQSQLNLKELMHGKPALLEHVEEIRENVKKTNVNIDELNESLIVSTTDLEGAVHQLEVNKNKNETELKDKECEHNKHMASLNEITKLQHNIETTDNANLTEQFEKVLGEAVDLKAKIADVINRKELATENVNKINIEVSNHTTQFRVLRDNQTLRQKRVEEQNIVLAIEELVTKIGRHNYGTIKLEKDNLNKDRSRIEKEIQLANGKKEEISHVIAEIKQDLEKPENKNIHTRYRDYVVEHKCLGQAIADLETYCHTLEKAVSAFHKTRMEQINNNIRQLWTQIYKGNDIDYIEIENDISHTGKRRTYKYRVMQKKNDTMVEMRGRCSSGQKVLACLIIRIALAETFSANCGILALDEPTTNLDRENIESLSESLANIINTRQAQKNFQLLVITHDQEFLSTLRKVDNVRYFYKISRNDKGCTIVTSELM